MLKVICPYCQCCFDTDEISDDGVISCIQCGDKFMLPPDVVVPSDNSDSTAENPDGTADISSAESGSVFQKIIRNTNNSVVNIVLLAVNILLLLICIIRASWLWENRHIIHQEITTRQRETEIDATNERCEINMNIMGNALLAYAKDNNGKLPDADNFRELCAKYAEGGYLPFSCPVSDIKTHFTKGVIKGKKSDTVLLSCPSHQRGFFADGKLRAYTEEEK